MRRKRKLVRFLITGEISSGNIAAFEVVVPSAQRLAAPAHSHDHYEETIYGIRGVLTWTVDREQIDVGPGQALCIPRGAVHRFDKWEAGRDGALSDHACCDWPAVFPRGRRDDQGGGWWPA